MLLPLLLLLILVQVQAGEEPLTRSCRHRGKARCMLGRILQWPWARQHTSSSTTAPSQKTGQLTVTSASLQEVLRH
ncbi:hypothetical protein V8C42DRAFT_307184 [Trichoderma barbatum]